MMQLFTERGTLHWRIFIKLRMSNIFLEVNGGTMMYSSGGFTEDYLIKMYPGVPRITE